MYVASQPFFTGHDRMADEFAEHLLVSSLAHMCKQQGWHQASRSGLSLFSDIAQHYIRNIGILTLRYSLHGKDILNLIFRHISLDLFFYPTSFYSYLDDIIAVYIDY